MERKASSRSAGLQDRSSPTRGRQSGRKAPDRLVIHRIYRPEDLDLTAAVEALSALLREPTAQPDGGPDLPFAA
jgi:hypothetical protein